MPRASLKQRKDGRYVVKYKGKQIYGGTQSEAYAKRDAYRRQLEAGLRAETEGLTVAAYAHRWIDIHKRDVTLKTRNGAIRELNLLLDAVGDMLLKDVVPSDIQRVLNLRAGKSASYIRHLSQTINTFFRSALGDRMIAFNPCVSVAPPRGKSGSHRAIEDWERELILTCGHRFRPAAMTMLYAGLRRGEVLALNVDRDVDFHAMTLTVREAVRFEGNTAILSSPKSEAGNRVIPLLDVLADALRTIRGLVAPAAHGGMMSETAFRRAWSGFISHMEAVCNGDTKRWYGKRSGQDELPPWKAVTIRPYDLRHSYCTMLYNAGVDLKTAQKWMGHADQTMTLRIYTHLTRQMEVESERKLRSSLNATIQNGIQNCIQDTNKQALPIAK